MSVRIYLGRARKLVASNRADTEDHHSHLLETIHRWEGIRKTLEVVEDIVMLLPLVECRRGPLWGDLPLSSRLGMQARDDGFR
jgi:hypothetical protein